MPPGPRPRSLVEMREYSGELPDQIATGLALGGQVDLPTSRPIRSITIAGVGGSAIAADLLASVLPEDSPLDLRSVRSPSLGPAGTADLVVATSYSGNSWEALAAYEEAGARRRPRLALTSGGELARRAERDGVPVLRVPSGRPPRAAVGWLLGGLLGIVGPGPFGPEGSVDWTETLRWLTRAERRLADPSGRPARLAARIGGRIPSIVTDGPTAALGRRWASQLAENAKRIARVEILPESMHNSLVAWDALPRAEARRHALVVLEARSPEPDRRLRRAATHLARVAGDRGATVDAIRLDGPTRVAAVLAGIGFGDHFSLFVAERDRVDPSDIRAIDRWKQVAARSGRPRARERS